MAATSSTRRHFLAGAASLPLLAAPGTRAATPAAGRWPAIAPPRSPRIAHAIAQLGRTRDDPYHWMKFVPATGERTRDNLPAPVARMLADENAYAEAMLKPLDTLRAELLEAMLARGGAETAAPAIERDGWSYWSAVPPGALHPVHYRRAGDGEPQILVDDAARAKGQPYFRSTGHQPSPDQRWFAWAEDVIGNDRHRILVRDNRNGQVRTLVDRDAYGYGAFVFSPSSRWLFWIRRDAHNRPTRLYRSSVESGETRLVYEESDPAIFMSVRRTAAGGFIALTLAGAETSEIRLLSAADETGTPVIAWPRRAGVRCEIDEWDGTLVALTDADDAFDMKLLRLDPESFRVTDILVPHRPGVPILSIHPFAGALARLERVDGLHRLVIRGRDGKDRSIAFDDPAYAIEVPADQAYAAASITIVHQSPKSPPRWIAVDLADGAQRVLAQQQVAHFDPDDYRVERLLAPTPDGETVPITLLSRRDAPRDGRAPLLQYGYGSYGVNSDPLFSVAALALVDRGWRYAIAHVRGGSEKGRRWFLDGRRFAKRNSFVDFVASARHLSARGYTAPGRIVAYGLSAGGLLVGGSMNLAPDLWGGVIAQVPFVDMLNTMSDAGHPLVPLFRPDWGDPLADPRAYDYIASISPYENVRAAPYPPLLCTAGLKDDRVAYWEPAKLVAEVRLRSTSANPAMLMTDMDSGHQGSADLKSEYAEKALFWAFAMHCAG
ncbi:S9 family peptidase [Sphingomonas colocasiae]|uniref:Prolyl oligopeptidase family serine peptidase n=1 Tax=Sphingomonas colocasiae TaxID=1848973 RepID=A0ABS7PY99_9SPHN|nr:prolyl oligopeptidase family serine peptidase [Sphingomonas colocasiae]MBY8826342.1 prolyl oligopeptidase family serine peptidase [Sphingomonas colocasiae]